MSEKGERGEHLFSMDVTAESRLDRGLAQLSLTLAVNATPTCADVAAGAAIPAVSAQVGTAVWTPRATRGPLLASARIAGITLAIVIVTDLTQLTTSAAVATMVTVVLKIGADMKPWLFGVSAASRRSPATVPPAKTALAVPRTTTILATTTTVPRVDGGVDALFATEELTRRAAQL